MDLQSATKNGTTEFVLSGRLVFADNPKFREIITATEQSGGEAVVIDVSRLEFVDSAGLGMFLLARNAANEHRVKLVLRRPAGQVERIFALSKFYDLFAIEK